MESTDRGNLDARSWCVIGKIVYKWQKGLNWCVFSGGKESASVLKVHGPPNLSCIETLSTNIG